MKILLLLSDLAYGGAARQVCQLAKTFATDSTTAPGELTVAVLGTETPLTVDLRRAGVPVHTLGWQRWFDPGMLLRLRTLVTGLAPDVIHVWRSPALRALALAVGRPPGRLIVSDPLPAGAPRLGMLDRWLLWRAQRILVGSAAAADRCRRFGLPADKIEVVRPAVEVLPRLGRGLPTPPQSGPPRLVCAGRLLRHKGFREAIWAFDILHYVAPDLRLQLLGDGPERRALERFVNRIHLQPLVEFAGAVPDVTPALAPAAIVWVPSLAPAGVQVALEAQALGRPVVASRLPELAEVVTDGETGCLANPGDKVDLARQTRQLLQDDARCRQLGEAGKVRVLRNFPIAELVRHVRDVYLRTAG